MLHFLRRIAPSAALVLLTLTSHAETGTPAKEPTIHAKSQAENLGEWMGYQRLDFLIDGKKSWLVLPKVAAKGNPWAWRTEFFGHEPQGDIALLGKGFHIAYTDVTNQYGGPIAMDHMDKFYSYLLEKHQLSAKTTLEGFSRGGLFALNWAIRHPERIACLYLDAPVCDILSWPAGFATGKGSPTDWERCKAIYGIKNDATARTANLGPMHHLATLAAAKVPILSVVGDADKVVPLGENSALLKTRYEALGGPMEMIVKPGCDHHPHSLKDPQPIVDFILKHTLP